MIDESAYELSALFGLLILGLVYLGWGGAITAVTWTVFLVAATVSLTQPLGWSSSKAKGWNVFARLWQAFQGRELLDALKRISPKPGLMVGLLLLSGSAVFFEIVGYWSIKQAFSSPLDDYVLMSDLSFVRFGIVIVVAGVTRIIPYTFASFGLYETVSIVMFWVLGEGFLAGAFRLSSGQAA